MRYLFTTDATRKQGGVDFTPVTRSGSQLFGTFSTEDDATADAVLIAGGKFVKEISADDFARYEVKKKHLEQSKSAFALPDRTNAILPRRAEPAAKAVSSSSSADILKPVKIK